ncbi:uncharacterized protein LOC6565816 isoform X2 [Drosophila grimshawi]|uniref:uncharacterized protein LOC6565816 isoform X2 n=1 Tax=Drosophila grimshawi TaxID=7222 RepID=UPI0013EEEABF|nr:uncharacterized protein LOC6565816 isoform X2 [Drosophila grimshawi]
MTFTKICLRRERILWSPICRMQQLMCRQSRDRHSSAAVTDSTVLTEDDFSLLLTEEQRQRCMEQLRNVPAFPRPKSLTPNRNEKNSAAVLIALCLEQHSSTAMKFRCCTHDDPATCVATVCKYHFRAVSEMKVTPALRNAHCGKRRKKLVCHENAFKFGARPVRFICHAPPALCLLWA